MASANDLENVNPSSIAQLERALSQLFQAFGHNQKTIQESMHSNSSDGYINKAIVLPNLSVFGLPLKIDPKRKLADGMSIECSVANANTGAPNGRGPEANA